MRDRLRHLHWGTALLQLLMSATIYLPLDALLGRPRYGLGGYVGTAVTWSTIALLGLPREKAGARPERPPRWRTVVLLLSALAVVPVSSAVFGLLWLRQDGVYGAALLVNAAVAALIVGVLVQRTLRRRRSGRFR